MTAVDADLQDRFLEELSETLDIGKTIKKLDITEEDARAVLKSLIKRKRPRGAAVEGTYGLFVDGASRGNPGQSGAGAVIKDPHGKVIRKLKRYLGVMTNNMAEYQALIMALEAASAMGIESVSVCADSELMVRHLTGVYKVRSEELRPMYEKALGLMKGFRHHKIVHVYREENSMADGLANEAIDSRHGAGRD